MQKASQKVYKFWFFVNVEVKLTGCVGRTAYGTMINELNAYSKYLKMNTKEIKCKKQYKFFLSVRVKPTVLLGVGVPAGCGYEKKLNMIYYIQKINNEK